MFVTFKLNRLEYEKENVNIGLSILLVSGAAVMANRVAGEKVIAGTDPNVEALKAVRKEPPCYLQSIDKSCKKDHSNMGCAACDDDIVVTPEKPVTNPTDK